jgi:hypothetical protein
VIGSNCIDDVTLEQVGAIDAEIADVGNAGRVREQLTNRDPRGSASQIRQMLVDRIVVLHLALLGEHHHRHRGERLRK